MKIPNLSLYCSTIALALVTSASTTCADTTSSAPDEVTVTWSKLIRVSDTTATLQVVVNPLLRPESPISHRANEALHHLGANYVRFVPWLPYPQLAVAELYPPANGKTSWNFKLIDPMVNDFMKATAGHSVIMNFSTIPEWMLVTPSPVTWPADPNEADWSYEQGTALKDTSLKTLADYYARLVSWYTKGGFKDEYGVWHQSGYHYHFAWWEVLNEVDSEHQMSVQDYSKWYDAITAAIHKVSPATKFVGIAFAGTSSWNPGDIEWFKYFLNHNNHLPGTPLDMISYHFYATPPGDSTPAQWPPIFFSQADGFISTVKQIEQVRKQLSPETKTDCDELGSILPNDNDPIQVKRITSSSMYWSLSGAMYAYIFAHLSLLGIQVTGESQLIGYPSQFPSVSMVNWNTGVPNARFRILALLHQNFHAGDRIVDCQVSSPGVFAQAYITRHGEKKLLLINEQNENTQVDVPGAKGGTEEWVDQVTAEQQPGKRTLNHFHVTLGGLAVAVITLKHGA